MGINSVGTTDSSSLREITFTGVAQQNSTLPDQGAIYKNKIVPAGNYEVELLLHGHWGEGATAGTSNNSIDGGNESHRQGSILAYDAVSGRPIAVYNSLGRNTTNNPLAGTFSIPKDSYIQIYVYNNNSSSNTMRYTVVLKPSNNPLKCQISFSLNNTLTNANQISRHFVMGWDYDNDEPAIIHGAGATGQAGIVSNPNTNNNAIWSSNIYVVRKNSTGGWTQKNFYNQAGGAFSWYDPAGNGYGGRPGVDTGYPCGNGGFYIKNNILHFFARQGMLTDSNSRRWGWIKANISGANDTNIFWEAGHSNTNFADSSSNIGTGNQGQMLYWYDAKTHKVVYNGYRRSSDTTTFWAKWVEYDVIADTVTVSSSGWGSYSGEVYTTGYTKIWDSYWVDTERGYFGGMSIGQSSVPMVTYKFAKDGTQLGFRQYPYYYSRSTSNNPANPPAGYQSFSAYAGRKALYFEDLSIAHSYISGANKTSNNPLAIFDRTSFMRNMTGGLGGNSNNIGVHGAKSQIMFAANKICVATAQAIVPTSERDGGSFVEPGSNPWTSALLMLSTMPRNNATEELMLPGVGGIWDPAVHTANHGVYWLTDVNTY